MEVRIRRQSPLSSVHNTDERDRPGYRNLLAQIPAEDVKEIEPFD